MSTLNHLFTPHFLALNLEDGWGWAARRREIDVVLVWRLDRWGRCQQIRCISDVT